MKIWTKASITCLGLLTIAIQVDASNPGFVPGPSYEQLVFDKEANKPGDQALVKKIREELTLDRTLSVDGKNIKVIVVGKEITLKGPVNSAAEKARIINIISKISSAHTIRDQIEVSETY